MEGIDSLEESVVVVFIICSKFGKINFLMASCKTKSQLNLIFLGPAVNSCCMLRIKICTINCDYENVKEAVAGRIYFINACN